MKSAASAVLLAALLLCGCAAVEQSALTDRSGWAVQREFLSVGGGKVEIFWAKPAEEGRRPAVLFTHGHQETNRNRRDERIPVAQAQAFAARLAAAGVPVRLKVFPGAGHGIPGEDQSREVYPFLARVLANSWEAAGGKGVE